MSDQTSYVETDLPNNEMTVGCFPDEDGPWGVEKQLSFLKELMLWRAYGTGI